MGLVEEDGEATACTVGREGGMLNVCGLFFVFILSFLYIERFPS